MHENEKFIKETYLAISGATAGFVTRAVTQPLDVVKIRFQLQVEPLKKNGYSKYTSEFQAFKTIYTEEGFKSLWKGHIPAQFLSISYGLTQFWVYENLCSYFSFLNNTLTRPVVEFGCGTTAGTLATIAGYPFDIARTRLVAQSENLRAYKGLLSVINIVVKEEGFVGLYKGLTPTVIAIGPTVGSQFMFYHIAERVLKRIRRQDEYSRMPVLNSLLSGGFAGLASKMIVYPLDLIRKRMQIQGFQKYRLDFGQPFTCAGMGNCIIQTVRKESFFGLYKGLKISLIKAIVVSASHFTVFEQMCNLLDCHLKR